MKFLKYLNLLLIALTVNSCNDFLEVDPQGQKTAEDLISELDENAPSQVVNAVYNQLYEWAQHSFGWIGVSSITSDDADKGSTTGDDGADKLLLDNFQHGPNDLSSADVYVGNFIGVSRANQALESLPGFLLDKDVENQLIGEVRFLRAYYYWNLVRCFGAVPKIDKVLDIEGSEDDFMVANTREAANIIYTELIIPDLEFAIEHLKSKTEQSLDEVGRATSGAARTFLAKVHMYRKNWAEVKRLTDEVIASGEYTIDGVPYEEIWREVGENSAESIWEIQCSGSDPVSKGIFLYTATQQYRELFGWGFNTPSQDLVDFYEDGDVRKDATIMFAGDNVGDTGETLWDGTVLTNMDPTIPPYANEKSYVSQTMETFNDDLNNTNKNLRIFRYAEVLLMNAEAAVNGAGGDATLTINAVRARAGLPPLSTVDVNDVWRERRAELAFEHDRFFDLVRQGRAAEVLGPLGFTVGKNELFPIPQSQIDLSEGMLIQNPGY